MQLFINERNHVGKLKKNKGGEWIKMTKREVWNKKWKIMMVEKFTWVRL